MSEQFYRVPDVMNPRLSVWAGDCEECGRRVRFGHGTRAMCRRIVVAMSGGRVLCHEHLTADAEGGAGDE